MLLHVSPPRALKKPQQRIHPEKISIYWRSRHYLQVKCCIYTPLHTFKQDVQLRLNRSSSAPPYVTMVVTWPITEYVLFGKFDGNVDRYGDVSYAHNFIIFEHSKWLPKGVLKRVILWLLYQVTWNKATELSFTSGWCYDAFDTGSPFTGAAISSWNFL
jgi:hypothetical protein